MHTNINRDHFHYKPLVLDYGKHFSCTFKEYARGRLTFHSSLFHTVVVSITIATMKHHHQKQVGEKMSDLYFHTVSHQ